MIWRALMIAALLNLNSTAALAEEHEGGEGEGEGATPLRGEEGAEKLRRVFFISAPKARNPLPAGILAAMRAELVVLAGGDPYGGSAYAPKSEGEPKSGSDHETQKASEE